MASRFPQRDAMSFVIRGLSPEPFRPLFALDAAALAARNMTAATGRVCERVMEPLAELVACPRASRWDA